MSDFADQGQCCCVTSQQSVWWAASGGRCGRAARAPRAGGAEARGAGGRQEPDAEATAKAQAEADEAAKAEGKDAAEPVEPVTKEMKRDVEAWTVQNDNKPLWTRNPREARRRAARLPGRRACAPPALTGTVLARMTLPACAAGRPGLERAATARLAASCS